jgi:ABC-type transport system involved in multi-copper enzyme maturation permease subunit
MLTIMKHQLVSGLRDTRLLFMATLVLLAFIANSFIYAERYHLALDDWQESIATTTDQLKARTENLQSLSEYAQRMVKPPTVLAFIADGGEDRLPNRIVLNAFVYRYPSVGSRGNDMFALLPSLDWVFIIGTLMSLMALLLSYATISGEKRDGTLRQLLSNPVSRASLFAGKYMGLLLVIIVILAIGAAINITLLLFLGALPLTEQIMLAIGWSVLASILCLSVILLLGMAVSSITHRPAVSLVILMIFWLVAIIAVPGLAKLIGENLVSVPTPYELQRDLQKSFDDIWYNAPKGAGSWFSNPEYAFSKPARLRAETVSRIISEDQKIRDRANDARIRQAETIRTLACVSPAGLLDDALQRLCRTGIPGYKALYETAKRYQQQLHGFVVERDRLDPSSPHTIYSWGFGVTPNTFSSKPVEFGIFPRSHFLWESGGLYKEQELPLIHIFVLLAINLQLAIIAFIALLCYDPR